MLPRFTGQGSLLKESGGKTGVPRIQTGDSSGTGEVWRTQSWSCAARANLCLTRDAELSMWDGSSRKGPRRPSGAWRATVQVSSAGPSENSDGVNGTEEVGRGAASVAAPFEKSVYRGTSPENST